MSGLSCCGTSAWALTSMNVETDVLVIGSGAAGMYAAIEAARSGAKVLLADRSLIGRGGATVMAQMTVAAALGEEVPDDPSHHYETRSPPAAACATKSCRGFCARTRPNAFASSTNGASAGRARMATSPRPPRRAMIGRAASTSISSIPARRCRRRCARSWRATERTSARPAISASSISSRARAKSTGAVGWHLSSGAPVTIAAKATVLATGGLTRLFRRNSASVNMGGDGYALALRAGASLIDMEFVQFFPIGHLAPRLVGMDPIMWDPFRYKLGGRLLNGRMEEFTSAYGSDEDGKYVLTRDLATYAILKEVEAGRGSPHGGAYLSFQHCTPAALREAFGPVIDRLAANNIDLTRMPVEVAPIAHYHMGGVKADAAMATDVPDCSSPAKWSAAPTARTGSRATPLPRRWCSAAAPAEAPPREPAKSRGKIFARRMRMRRSTSCAPARATAARQEHQHRRDGRTFAGDHGR